MKRSRRIASERNRPHDTRIIGNRLINCATDSENIALIQALGDDVEVAGNRANGGKFPSLVWSDGKNVRLSDNSVTGVALSRKYNVEKAAHPIVSDP